MTPMKFTPPLKSLESVHEMFQYIVEDSFYSPTFGKVIVVKDDGGVYDVHPLQYSLTDDEVKTLYQEWHTTTFADSYQ
jgi:hypothetical protein